MLPLKVRRSWEVDINEQVSLELRNSKTRCDYSGGVVAHNGPFIYLFSFGFTHSKKSYAKQTNRGLGLCGPVRSINVTYEVRFFVTVNS